MRPCQRSHGLTAAKTASSDLTGAILDWRQLFRRLTALLRRRRDCRREPENLARAFQSSFYVWADILAADLVQKPGLVHHQQRLGMRPAQNHVFLLPMQSLKQVLERIEPGRVHRHDV